MDDYKKFLVVVLRGLDFLNHLEGFPPLWPLDHIRYLFFIVAIWLLSFFYLSFFFVGLFHGFFAPCTAPQYSYYKDSTVNTFSNPNCGPSCLLLLLLPDDLIPPLLQDESHLWEQQKCFYLAWNVLTTKDNNLAIPTVGSRTLSCRFYQRPTCLTEIMW